MSSEKRLPHGTIALPPRAGEGNGMGAECRDSVAKHRLTAAPHTLTPTLFRTREQG